MTDDIFILALDKRESLKRWTRECKKCGLQIAFRRLSGGKFCPENPDGSDHWDICRATQRAGRPFDPAKDMQSSGVITGSKYIEQSPTDDEVPWN